MARSPKNRSTFRIKKRKADLELRSNRKYDWCDSFGNPCHPYASTFGDPVELSGDQLYSNLINLGKEHNHLWPDTCLLPILNERMQDALFSSRTFVPSGIENEFRAAFHSPLDDPAYGRQLRRVGDAILPGFEYWFQLLTYRKVFGEQLVSQFIEQHQREPVYDTEFKPLVNKIVGQEGENIAWDGYKNRNSPNRFNDEELVAKAFVHSLLTGQNAIILTRDEGVFSQAMMLGHKMLGDIQSMYVSELVSGDPLRHRPSTHQLPEFFDGEFASYEVDLRIAKSLLPKRQPLVIACWKITNTPKGYRCTPLMYVFDRANSKILHVKDETHGRNTNRFGGRNAYYMFGRYPDGRPYSHLNVGLDRFDARLDLRELDKHGIIGPISQKLMIG